MKTTLAVICLLTLLATVYLSLSLLTLHPPRANYREWFIRAALLASQSGLTLIALFAAVPKGLKYLALIGGAGIIWAGVSIVNGTMSGAHFEGYALVLGGMLMVQGVATLAVLGIRVFKSG